MLCIGHLYACLLHKVMPVCMRIVREVTFLRALARALSLMLAATQCSRAGAKLECVWVIHAKQVEPSWRVSQAWGVLCPAQVRAGLSRQEGPSALAHRLAAAAFQASLDRAGQTPYSLGASEAFDMIYSGACI